MKYIKTYESEWNDENYFWLISCKNEAYFLASLRHVNLLENFDFDSWLVRRDVIINKHKGEKYYVSSLCGFMPISNGYKFYIDMKYQYMGEIIPTKKEVKLAELELATNKYNI